MGQGASGFVDQVACRADGVGQYPPALGTGAGAVGRDDQIDVDQGRLRRFRLVADELVAGQEQPLDQRLRLGGEIGSVGAGRRVTVVRAVLADGGGAGCVQVVEQGHRQPAVLLRRPGDLGAGLAQRGRCGCVGVAEAHQQDEPLADGHHLQLVCLGLEVQGAQHVLGDRGVRQPIGEHGADRHGGIGGQSGEEVEVSRHDPHAIQPSGPRG